METMDYNNYFAPAPHTFGYLGFGHDANVLGHGANNDGHGAVESMEASFDANTYVSNAFEYNFDSSVAGAGGNALAIAHSPDSASPPAQQLSLLRNDSFDGGLGLDLDNESLPREDRRSNSVDKELLTPAQSRRKAQNRAAQRAFRERKERHVRDLETKLNLLTTTTSSLQSDNERLKLLLQRAQTENEILKATASSSPTRHHPPGFVDDPTTMSASRSDSNSSDDEPQLDRTRLANGLLSTETTTSSQTSPQSDSSHLLSAGATWDLLQSHPLYSQGALDIGRVCERLKGLARCDGTGPMFDEHDVRAVIEEVGSDGNDSLI